jgi:hypothetical protein
MTCARGPGRREQTGQFVAASLDVGSSPTMRTAADLLRTRHWAATGLMFMLLTALVALHLGLCSPDHHHDHAPASAAAVHVADSAAARHPHQPGVGQGAGHDHLFCDLSTPWLAEPRAAAARLAALLALLAGVLFTAGVQGQPLPPRRKWLGFVPADRPPLGQAKATLLSLCVSRT